MIAWDFVGPNVEHDERRELASAKRKRIFRSALELPRFLRFRSYESAERSEAGRLAVALKVENARAAASAGAARTFALSLASFCIC